MKLHETYGDYFDTQTQMAIPYPSRLFKLTQ